MTDTVQMYMTPDSKERTGDLMGMQIVQQLDDMIVLYFKEVIKRHMRTMEPQPQEVEPEVQEVP